MPDFLDEFAASVKPKKETIKEKIFKGQPNPLHDSFRNRFAESWVPLESAEFTVDISELAVMAVDSSIYTNLLSTGGIFYIIRSLALCKDKERKELETDIFFTKAGFLEAYSYVIAKMEMLEFQAALNALKDGIKCSVILLDGSLYGRVAHLPIETKIEEDRVAPLNYFKVYKELLDFCKREKILIAGISKESRSTFHRDYFLTLIFKEEIERLDLTIDDLRVLKALFSEVLDKKTLDFQKLERIRRKYGPELETTRLILKELGSSRPDYQLIMNFAETTGYTRPMLQGLSNSARRKLKLYRSNPRRYVDRYFPVSVTERHQDFVEWAVDVVSGIADFPGFASLYVLLDKRDSPIKIDLPWWDCLLSDVGMTKPVTADLENLLKTVVTGYCGLDCHNLWLKNVDERVRLKKRIVDNIYFPYMEKLFQSKIIRGRSYRRVKYP